MKTHFQILVVGGGNAGISVAAQLLLKNDQLKIGIIEPSAKHYYQPAWTLVAGGTFDINDTVRPQKACMPEKATWIQDAVATFQPESNTVTTKNGTVYSYDFLIAAPGIQLDWHKIKGLPETLGKNNVCSNYAFDLAPYTWETLRHSKGGNMIFTSPNTPVKCGGAPQKIMYLAADYLRKNDLLATSKVHFYSGGTIIFGIKKYAETLNKVVERYGIQTHFKHNLVEIDGANKIAYFENEQKEGVSQPFDMIHVTPPQSAPDFIKNSPLAVAENPLGWIDVNKYTLQHSKYSNIFACGDAINAPCAKTGASVRKQVPVLVHNVLQAMANKPLDANYNGYGSCPLITGYGKLVLAEFDYNNQPLETFPFDQAQERWSMWALKKYVLPWLYWNKILKGTA